MSLILDLLFPKRCVVCRKFGAFICGKCAGKIKAVSDICPVCERPAMIGETHELCRTRYALDGLTSGFFYAEPIKAAIHKLKYKPYISELTPILVNLFLKQIGNRQGFSWFLKKKPVIVPIPLHFWRKHLRGYNQAELLALSLSKSLKLPVLNLLIRKKLSKPQSELSFKKRKENVAHIFMFNEKYKKLIPENVLLLDDVWTTGSTLKSAGNVLKRNGVKTIWGLTLAR